MCGLSQIIKFHLHFIEANQFCCFFKMEKVGTFMNIEELQHKPFLLATGVCQLLLLIPRAGYFTKLGKFCSPTPSL